MGGIQAWKAEARPVSRVPVMPAQELVERLEREKPPAILDVRSDAEWQAGHLPHAAHVEAGGLPYAKLPFSKEELKVIHCGHGDRATVGISVLEQRGFQNLVLLEGGFSGLESAGYPVARDPNQL
jgi:hydroxyacylglutathione hydrolase